MRIKSDKIQKQVIVTTIVNDDLTTIVKDSGHVDFAGAIGEICIYVRFLNDAEIK